MSSAPSSLSSFIAATTSASFSRLAICFSFLGSDSRSNRTRRLTKATSERLFSRSSHQGRVSAPQ